MVLVVGEVDTGLLRGRDPSSSDDDGRSLVELVAGERVLVHTRPRSYVRSPERPVGVDCALGPVRGIGTALQRAAITDNEVVQGSAYATIVPSAHTARRPWSHYLAQPGRIETLGKPRWDAIADALGSPDRAPAALDLGAVAQRATNEVQSATRGGPEDSFRAARSRLRWVARPGRSLSGVHFEVHDRRLRLLRFTAGECDADRLAAACEDIALHDWLLSTLIESVRKSAAGLRPRADTLRRLGPAVDHLLHLWMPAARADELTEAMWTVLERRAGFTRQWTTLATRIRDQFSVMLAESLSSATRS
ncbi:SCO2521 family protein [Actinoplanes sp. KI2]|uniref:SCO2521 family protein n=1 Tax=Actinoplanes sp. KI2 TaxID=2983315 RepID=UPI0021D609D0|nr:SCO2521 family protein [Actinoplanes sp. KI2]MCU7728693.1 SCO2521 family protein [Actinoplanes sp. KI2]